ncbi:glycine/D-amino acid oxidase-like deaminating enzyme [Dysgonomonas alginatilytica]|uniref:Glycine/D-amino acid oxidase-like deaminating enzyme n=1 Tax=Dysgonomonas alginatilytica TaxID=1605892 RepID=A0A2V3PQX5_9BACT|nr:FAD-dependent oxidoreductase [Dysgonomonas alginatilytica]PXV66777.1 glycine/D-amino acid oxidase-like deaminating enzyme [Dysgonomonas alginatilytica]
MDLHSGLPYWIVKNPLYDYFNPLEKDIAIDIAIIGSGITGALVAHELCEAGLKCCVVDKRTLSTGSSSASTALLQYEIDVPLYKMAKELGEDKAVLAYRSCLQGITDIEKIFTDIGINPNFERVPSVFYASNKQGLSLIEKEFEIRKKHNLPVTFLDNKELKKKYGIDAPGALMNKESGQIDAYLAAITLLDYHRKKDNLKVYTHTEIDQWTETTKGYELVTIKGKIIKCKYVVIAAGFEVGKFLPEQVMKLTSTYVIISQPVLPEYLWYKKSLIWETNDPYLYIRTTNENRIMVGGEDEEFKDPVKRDDLLREKTAILEKKFKKLFPKTPFITDMSWCGTFSSTKDGLPYIGTWPGKNRMFFTLGYGGNGITFSINAAQMIRNKLEGKTDPREAVFGFKRRSKT